MDASEQLLKRLGISEPADIDLDAISYFKNATVKYRELDACDADIIGFNDRAIITIDPRSSPQRKRFSIAHELGHWHFHRGQRLQCRVSGYQPRHKQLAERKANDYAASLLMPKYMVTPRIQAKNYLSFKMVEALSSEFNVSFTAMAIRLVELDYWPVMLLKYNLTGREWFTAAPMFHDRWFPSVSLNSDSSAYDILFKKGQNDIVRSEVDADTWFDRDEANRYEIYEESRSVSKNEVLTILTIKDGRMLDEPN